MLYELTFNAIGLSEEYGRGFDKVNVEALLNIKLYHLGTALWTRPEWLTCGGFLCVCVCVCVLITQTYT